MDATTKHPVVLIHGVFGYGRTRPLWNAWSPYWPEQALREMRANHVIVDVGALSSDHDRACEAFYQLVGGRVDYGEAHAREAGHNRFGATFATPLLANWSAEHPVHLVGHSFGATTAIELYQLICQDAFGVGSDHRWVQSIVSIAGPLSGTTLTHVFGLHDATMRAYTLGHAIGSALGLWFKLHTDFPILKRVFDFRMPQWECVESYREVLSATGRINRSTDLAVFNILPALRLERNSRLVHMDKVFLTSVATSSYVELPHTEVALALAVALLSAALGVVVWTSHTVVSSLTALLALLTAGFALQLLKCIQQLDYATIPSLHACMVLMAQRVRTLHEIFHGFERCEWEHNDGAVNLHSMLRTWTPASIRLRANATAAPASDCTCCKRIGSSDDDECASSTSTASSSAASSPRSLESSAAFDALACTAVASALSTTASSLSSRDCDAIASLRGDDIDALDLAAYRAATQARRLERGRWYVHRVRKNHMAGTHLDRDAPQLFRDLLRVIAREFE